MFTIAFAQDTAAVPQVAGQQQNPMVFLIMWALILGVIYFLVIKPQKKTQQDHAKMLQELQKNDEVITGGGIHGTIVNIQDNVLTLRIDDNVKIKIERSGIARKK